MTITKRACRTVRRHYNLTRPVTPTEVQAEVDNLLRKTARNWDDNSRYLAAALECLPEIGDLTNLP